MEEIYPVCELQQKFKTDVCFDYYFMKDIDAIAELEPHCLCEIGGNAWMHYIESGAKVDPRKLSDHFDKGNPFLFREVEKVLKRKVIQDIMLVHAKVQDPELDHKICGQLLLARVYPNNLHISDVEFSNPYKPVTEGDKKYHFHEYRSLGLFVILLKNIIAYGKLNRIAKITLSAASDHQIKYFKSHGFSIESNSFAKDAIEHGMSIPMERKCI
jgi:hypothetical protein